jgi:NAD(P)-dependent dehydrogenase (short-subunit alcohol dehydrogenase family)
MGTLFTVQHLLPLMSEGASIILNGTTSATKGIPGAGVYSASKAALRSLARTWAAELKDRGIRVNVISPGSIETALFGTVTPEFREQIISAIPLGRLGTRAEIAAAALFFASADSGFVNGAKLVVDGGFAQILALRSDCSDPTAQRPDPLVPSVHHRSTTHLERSPG